MTMPVPKNILVTGSNSQLAQCIADLSQEYSAEFNFHFKSKAELDITEASEIEKTFAETNFDYCINCAAYTAVDKAEDEEEKAYLINAEAVKYLAEACASNNTILIHISTDFVFDGKSKSPYVETDETNPLGVYGASKRLGETYIEDSQADYVIVRTSWLYSEYGHNFLKTMLRLSESHNELHVVNDQIGSPTYAGNLAASILRILQHKKQVSGIFHYSDGGETSWFDFAKEIFKQKKLEVKVNPISSAEYESKAKRPSYSVLDTFKIKGTYGVDVPMWSKSLEKVISRLQK